MKRALAQDEKIPYANILLHFRRIFRLYAQLRCYTNDIIIIIIIIKFAPSAVAYRSRGLKKKLKTKVMDCMTAKESWIIIIIIIILWLRNRRLTGLTYLSTLYLK